MKMYDPIAVSELFAPMVNCAVFNGSDILDPDINFEEFDKLERLLVDAEIPYEKQRNFSGKQIAYPRFGDDLVCSVILHRGSYGHEEGLLEIMGLLTDEEYERDSVAGCLTADDVFNRIKNHWDGN